MLDGPARGDDPHAYWMRRALVLAESVLYCTAPNPRVGAIIVRDGVILGQGATQPVGGSHAEVCALNDACRRGADVQGATVYVTLEPCSHHGRTPPCVNQLVQARVGRVVVAMGDPNPCVAGQGYAILRDAGIEVIWGVCTQEALALNVGFVARITRATPWLWAKMAASLDGRSALQNGQSQWITGKPARADGHHWRARSDVVLTGIGTIEKDDPQLTVREVLTTQPPRKAVIDGVLRIRPDARLFDGSEVWVFTAVDAPERAAALRAVGARIIHLPSAQLGRVDLAGVLRWMGEQEINEVHVEAGAGLTGALIEAQLVDELLVYLAPVLLGDAIGLARLPKLERLDATRRYAFHEVRQVGEDVRLRARVAQTWDRLIDCVQLHL
jgi:diaminohydroxyphosphoribosylaminopyrimidine deaminase/5-amino-6-(5-phosphoribosylamino)uracil reductase